MEPFVTAIFGKKLKENFEKIMNKLVIVSNALL